MDWRESVVLVRKANVEDVDAICRVCAEGYRATYPSLLPERFIERTIAEFYNPERVRSEIGASEGWNGWYVAEENGVAVGAGGGGMTGPGAGELFVLYVDPRRLGQGIGTRLLDAITEELRAQGAREQWVSTTKDNAKAIPFYKARGFVDRGERPMYTSDPGEGLTSVRMVRKI